MSGQLAGALWLLATMVILALAYWSGTWHPMNHRQGSRR